MNNPFVFRSESQKKEYISHLCSINRVRIARVPVKGIDDDIEGMMANEIFSAKVISDDVRATAEKMGLDVSSYSHRDLPRLLSEGLTSDDMKLRSIATRLSTKYGNRLGLILLTLRTGLDENRQARKNWQSIHWNYWANIKNVILTGGLASGMLGKRIKEQIQYVFDVAGEKPYNIQIYENSSHIGAMGCARLVEDSDKTFAVLDMGQTNIKRCIIRKRGGEIANVTTLETVPSINMDLDYADTDENYSRALALHKYILNVVCDVCRRIDTSEDGGEEVIISIANYVVGGVLNPHRGGYAKLSLLSADYAGMLTDEVSSRLHRSVKVRLVHDGTAIALNFRDTEDTVCISLGTAFGVGFPVMDV